MVPNTFEGSDITIAGTSGVNGKTLVECQEACDAEATCTGFAKTFHPLTTQALIPVISRMPLAEMLTNT